MVVHPLKVAFFTVHPTGNIGIHIIGKRGKIWLLGISLLALIHHPIGIDPPMDPNPSKVEFLDQNPSRLLSMSTLLAQQTLKMLSAHSILLSQTRHGTWTPEPPLT
jgi:hypothetical protein